jgi:hypothetical protein
MKKPKSDPSPEPANPIAVAQARRNVEIRYNGTVKTIEDYGELGTFGLKWEALRPQGRN